MKKEEILHAANSIIKWTNYPSLVDYAAEKVYWRPTEGELTSYFAHEDRQSAAKKIVLEALKYSGDVVETEGVYAKDYVAGPALCTAIEAYKKRTQDKGYLEKYQNAYEILRTTGRPHLSDFAAEFKWERNPDDGSYTLNSSALSKGKRDVLFVLEERGLVTKGTGIHEDEYTAHGELHDTLYIMHNAVEQLFRKPPPNGRG
jgi:hypothetical protein